MKRAADLGSMMIVAIQAHIDGWMAQHRRARIRLEVSSGEHRRMKFCIVLGWVVVYVKHLRLCRAREANSSPLNIDAAAEGCFPTWSLPWGEEMLRTRLVFMADSPHSSPFSLLLLTRKK